MEKKQLLSIIFSDMLNIYPRFFDFNIAEILRFSIRYPLNNLASSHPIMQPLIIFILLIIPYFTFQLRIFLLLKSIHVFLSQIINNHLIIPI